MVDHITAIDHTAMDQDQAVDHTVMDQDQVEDHITVMDQDQVVDQDQEVNASWNSKNVLVTVLKSENSTLYEYQIVV